MGSGRRHNGSVAVRRKRATASLVSLMGLGFAVYGACGPMSLASSLTGEGTAPPDGSAAPGAPTPGPAAVLASDADAGGLPAGLSRPSSLTAEALAARADAQARLLGRDGLFEDAAGRPVPVIAVEPSLDDLEVVAEDDLLTALPGSAGFDAAAQAGGGVKGPRANGNALGLFVPIEGEAGALSHFHAALAELQAGSRERVRVAVYGASHTQADVYPGYLRAYLQQRLGNGGRGFVPLVRVNGWHRTVDYVIEHSKGWKLEHAQRKDRRDDGWYGLLGASASSESKKDWARVSPRDPTDAASHGSRYAISYLAQPGGGRFEVFVDGKKHAKVRTDSDTIRHGVHSFELPLGAHTVEVRPLGDGEVRVFGVTIEREEPGVVVDTLGIAGTRASNHLRWDETVWAAALAERDPDLVILAYGTNETTDEYASTDVYRRELEQVVGRVRRAAPDASCVLVAPGDFPREVEPGVWATRPRLLELVEIQREVAEETGCGFFDTFTFMGGAGSMHTWATAQPQMASKDHIHLSKRGYVRLGMTLTDALVASFEGRFESGLTANAGTKSL